MDLSTILDTALGLALIYLLFSLLVSALNEVLLGHLAHLRARTLEEGLRALLSGQGDAQSEAVKALKIAWSILTSAGSLFIGGVKRADDEAPRNFAEILFQHPLVRGLSSGRSTPGYLPPATFVDAVLETLGPAGLPAAGADFEVRLAAAAKGIADPFAAKVLAGVLAGATTAEEARTRLERWFNDSMDRVSGSYKRHVQFWLYLWAAALTLWLNLDTVDLTRRLVTDAQFRGALVASATQLTTRTNVVTANGVTSTNVVATAPDVGVLASEIGRLNLPLGWGACTNDVSWIGVVFSWLPRLQLTAPGPTSVPSVLAGGVLGAGGSCPKNIQEWRLKLVGLMITIAALSQGAPFWFDVLNKITNLRASGKPPAKPAT